METITIESDDVEKLDSQEESQCNKRVKISTADCWKFFTKLGPDKDGIEKAKCNACGQEYKAGGKTHGTTSLNRHIEKCKEIKYEDIGQMVIDMHGRLKPGKIDQMLAREMLAVAIIEHDLPFSFVEYEKIREWIKYLNPDFVPISRNTAKSDVLNIYKREKEKLKHTLASIPGRICLTSDLWTSCTTEGYICLTAHFVDKKWRLNSKILNFSHMPPPHSGFELSKTILGFLKEWEIEKKVFSLTLDNASANDNMISHILKSQLVMQNMLLCDGEFFHVRCSAHILNLIVQEGLKVANVSLMKIRESVKYVKGSEGRAIKFKECIDQIGDIDISSGLRLDVPTRWNSTYLMLQSALGYQRVFTCLQLNDSHYKFCPSAEEWKRGEKLCIFLKPFYDITTLISGTSYPTSNIYFEQVWKIQCILIHHLNDEDELLKTMAENMLMKFGKYWDDYSIQLAFGFVLDPRMKLDSLKFCYSQVDEFTADQKVEQTKRKLYMLYEKYASNSSSTSTDQSDITSQSSSGTRSRDKKDWELPMFGNLKMLNHHLATKIGRSQLDIYLEETSLCFEYYEHLNVLQWWRENSKRFPDLSLMARDLLSIPITTVASESAFSIGARVLNKYRNSLLPTCVEALICTRNWLNDFDANGEDIEDESLSVASNNEHHGES